MDYTAHMIARAEHERMVRSVPKVYDYDPLPEAKVGLSARFRLKLHNWLRKRNTRMDDFDAKNHLRDLRREADNERLAQLVEAGAEAQKPKVAHRSLFTTIIRLLAGLFAQARRQGS